jgi:AraC-like DNA-binding protein
VTPSSAPPVHDGAVPLEIRLKPVETLLFRSDIVGVGRFRCPASHQLFRDSGPCSHHTFVFPRSVTAIRLDDGHTFVGSPASVVFYNQHQLYTRSKISDVDVSDWVTLADEQLAELLSTDDLDRPFTIAETTLDAETFLRQRRLFDALDRDEHDALAVEEAVLGILRRVVPASRRFDRAEDAVEEARTIVTRHFVRPLSLGALSRAVGLSPFALCRAFRARTGQTLTRYRDDVRLRLALDRLRDPAVDLTDLALDLGYASHSHFTARFRRRFGIVPSAVRARS